MDPNPAVNALAHVGRGVNVNLRRNAPFWLTLTSVIGVGVTSWLFFDAGRETERDFMANPPKDRKDELTRIGKHILVPSLSGIATAGSMVGSTKIANNRTAMYAELYTASSQMASTLGQKIVEQVGENKAKEINAQAVDEVRQTYHPLTPDTIIEETGKGTYICYDEFGGRYFYSSETALKEVANIINKRLIGEYSVSLNEVYSEMGLAPTSIGYDVGFTVDNFVEFQFSDGHVSEADRRPCKIVNFLNKPVPEFNYFR
jgi:hypothetical protein